MKERRVFLTMAAIIMTMTGVLKLFSATRATMALNLPDPVLYLTHRQVFVIVGALELALAVFLLFGKSAKIQLIALAWLTTNFVIYRIVMWWGGSTKPCGCLGNAMDWSPWLMKHQDTVMKGLLTFMLVGAYGFLWHELRIIGKRREEVKNMMVE